MSEKNLKIMIVDDDKFLLDMYSIKFKSKGFDISAVAGSNMAIEKLRNGESPDIILLDIIMPTMDGLELLKKIRDEKLVPNAKIVMLTNQPDEYDKAHELGIDGYIVKATTIPSEVVSQVSEIYKAGENNKNK